MAYFKPVKDYQLHLIKKVIQNYNIKNPFLEIGCGTGDFLKYLNDSGFKGVGIDKSKTAIAETSKKKIQNVKLFNIDLFDFNYSEKFNFILMIDVLEHIENDLKALSYINKLLNRGGFLIFQVPSHRRKYCWIDINYGHFRRYDRKDIINIVKKSGFELVELWCSGFPFISLMEDFISNLGKIFKSFFNKSDTMEKKTAKSGIKSPISEKISITEKFFNVIFNIKIIWKFLFKIMDIFLKSNSGSTYFVVVRKN